jgi:hypothetical protein
VIPAIPFLDVYKVFNFSDQGPVRNYTLERLRFTAFSGWVWRLFRKGRKEEKRKRRRRRKRGKKGGKEGRMYVHRSKALN